MAIKTCRYKNNPLNLRYSPTNNWFEQMKPTNGFCRFSSMAAGLRASLITMYNYHLDSIQAIISRWCPLGDGTNDPLLYYQYVKCFYKDFTLCELPEKIDWYNVPQLYHIFLAFARVETSLFMAFSRSDFDSAYNMFSCKCLTPLFKDYEEKSN